MLSEITQTVWCVLMLIVLRRRLENSRIHVSEREVQEEAEDECDVDCDADNLRALIFFRRHQLRFDAQEPAYVAEDHERVVKDQNNG